MESTDAKVMDRIAKIVESGHCILFLGAGVHHPPPARSPYEYPEEERPPLGGSFSKHLASLCSFAEKFPAESSLNLQRVSLCYEQTESRESLVEEIRRAVERGKSPSPVIQGLAELPFPLIVTTNYDQLFERAFRKTEKNPYIEYYRKEEFVRVPEHTPAADRPFLFKVHGDIDYPESIVITDEDYIHFILRMSDKDPYHPIPETFRYHLKRWPTIFIGYSLMDYNLRLLFKTLRWNVDRGNFPKNYSVDPYPDPLIVDIYGSQQKHVSFLTLDVWNFVPDIYARVLGRGISQ